MSLKKLKDNKSAYGKKSNIKRGRPSGSNNVRVVPVFRDEIDIKKLGQAALKLASMQMEDGDHEE